ncbi:MAG: hypothetical protein ACOYXA_11270 [Bacteroidota bacterium]
MKNVKLIMMMLTIGSLAFLISCKEDEEPETLPPSLNFTDADGATSAERGTSVNIEVNLLAQGGIKSLTANGATVPVTAGEIQQTVTFVYEVADTEVLGAKAVDFILTDNKDREAKITYTVTVIGSTIQVTNDITANTTWNEGNVYVLNKKIKVENATLTIERGVTVQAVDDGKPVQDETKVLVALRVEPTGKLVANGEVGKPVVFTVKTQGTAAPAEGMWRGIIITGDPLAANHNAGTLKYVRVEYGGGDEDNPIDDKAALTFINVGISTIVEYVQVYKSLGQGFRVEGSTLALKNCISTENKKSNLQLRHTGSTAADIRHANVYVQNYISNTISGNKDSRDILISNPPNGLNGNTLTASNMTILGPGAAYTFEGAASTVDGMRAESRAGKVLIYNSIFAEFPEDGIRLSNNVAESRIEYSYFFKIGGADDSGIPTLGNSTALRENAVQFATGFNNIIEPAATAIAGIGVNDYTPNATQASAYNPTALNDSNFTFLASQFVGAISTTDWTAGGWAKNADGSIRP